MKNLVTSLMVMVFLAMSVAAHGTPGAALQKSGTPAAQTNFVSCMDLLVGDGSGYQKACKIKPGESSECKSFHCVFHYLALAPANYRSVYSTADSYIRHAARPLEARFPESEKRPPRNIS